MIYIIYFFHTPAYASFNNGMECFNPRMLWFDVSEDPVIHVIHPLARQTIETARKSSRRFLRRPPATTLRIEQPPANRNHKNGHVLSVRCPELCSPPPIRSRSPGTHTARQNLSCLEEMELNRCRSRQPQDRSHCRSDQPTYSLGDC